eukprot:813015-Prymnesium_polylepis.1
MDLIDERTDRRGARGDLAAHAELAQHLDCAQRQPAREARARRLLQCRKEAVGRDDAVELALQCIEGVVQARNAFRDARGLCA